jgi:hypothetical protein
MIMDFVIDLVTFLVFLVVCALAVCSAAITVTLTYQAVVWILA